MLKVCPKDDNHSTCFKFIGADSTPQVTHLISKNTALISSQDTGVDTCSFYSGPSDAAIMAFGEGSESCGSIACESLGSIASSGGSESCGSIASASVSCSSSFSGGGCSYSC